MALTGALLSARSGILGAQAGIEVVSRNIANASTEGYTRKIHNQSNLVLSGVGAGIRIDEITREVTKGLQREVREQTAIVEELEVIDDFLGRLEQEFGSPDDQSSISAKLTDLKLSIQAFATTPEDGVNQVSVISAAQELARAFNDLNNQIQSLREDADARINFQVNEVNTLMTNIDTLNTKIVKRRGGDLSDADLQDQRDQSLLDVSQKLSVTSFERSDGKISVFAPGGNLMLDDTRLPLSFTSTASITAASVTGAVQVSTGAGTTSISTAIAAGDGSLAGLLRVRDTLLPNVQLELDDLAFEVARNFGQITVAGTTENLNLFAAPGRVIPPGGFTTGYSGEMEVRAALSTQPALLADPQVAGGYTPLGPGDPTLPLAIISVFEAQQQLSRTPAISNTMEGFMSQLIGSVANQKADVESQLTFQTNFRDGLKDRFNDESGVNTDQELSELIRLEAAFSASARVLSAVQRAVEELSRVI
ncbi:MAG: flagellar hook-associated protein FlgK [Alphaproteobacteria bacterium]|nr:flagellar hook-associated protein FlgK [Alphaproteobacteria bacterium]